MLSSVKMTARAPVDLPPRHKTRAEWEAWMRPPVGTGRELYNERRRKGRKPQPWHTLMQRRVNALIKGAVDPALEDLLGYSAADLKQHLERAFEPRMTWSNYAGNVQGRHVSGVWVVDHIIPKSTFTQDQAREAFCITNLRPLWIDANRSKGCARLHLL